MSVLGTKERAIKIGWGSTWLVTLLIATLLAFFFRYFPYPYGWIAIAFVLIARLTTNSRNNGN
jgi:cobalamin biosynthesis protein CobD/CbiB